MNKTVNYAVNPVKTAYDSQAAEGILTMLDYLISLGNQDSTQDAEEESVSTEDEYDFDNAYAEYLKGVYVELEPTAGGEWTIEWNEESLSLASGGKAQTISLGSWNRGFNHLAVLFEGEDTELNITGFSMRGTGGMKTGIEY